MWKWFCHTLSHTNKISFLLIWIFFVFPFHSRFYLPIFCQLPLSLVVVGGPFLLGKFVWMSPFGSFQTTPPIPLPWLMPWCLSWCCITHVLTHFLDELLLYVCCWWILGQGKSTHPIWCMPMVLRCRIHLNICVGSYRFLYILSLRLDATDFSSRTRLFVSLYLCLVLYAIPPGSSVPLKLLVQRIYHNTRIFQQSSGVFFG